MLKSLPLLMIATHLVSTIAGEPFRQVLTSSELGLRLDHWQVTHREVAPQSATPWSVRKSTLHGGKQEGVDVIEVNNGALTFTVIPTRGMGILKAEMGDVRLGWDSPVKEVVHPQYVNLQSRGGLGWLEGFNEWMVRCGLEFAGHPGKDKFINNVGDEAEMDLTLHGKIGNIPASEVEVVMDREPPHRIRIRGRVDERMFYGPKLEMWTEISTVPGAGSFRIEDTIKNHGAFDQEFQLIYHSNFGPPLLEKGSRLLGAFQRVTPFNARAARSVAQFAEYAGPTKGFIEEVYCIVPYADNEGRTLVMLQNAAADRAVSVSFSLEQLPYFTLWKNTTALEEGYVTGLEPGTGFPQNRRVERRFGRVPKLAPGQRRQFTLDFVIHAGANNVARAAEQIGRVQAGRKTEVDAEPAKAD
ncbi:MAG: aldose 1-epimerase family protein [Chloroflexi bacterium]|nr:aldose 1-epimerase family protein [Chloroflexota bacterium]